MIPEMVMARVPFTRRIGAMAWRKGLSDTAVASDLILIKSGSEESLVTIFDAVSTMEV